VRPVRPEDLARALKDLVEWAHEHAPAPEPEVRRRLRDHFGTEPIDLPVVARGLAPWDRPNLQAALDAWTPERDVELLGLPVMQGYRAGLAELVRGSEWLAKIRLGAVEHVTVPLGEHDGITCVKAGLWLVRDGDVPLVLMLKSEDFGPGENLSLEVMAADRGRAEAVLAEIWALMAEHNLYRGRVLELSARHFHEDEGRPSRCGRCRRSRATGSCSRPACSSGSSARRSASPATRSGCAPAAATCAAACCCTDRPAPARR
jgi:hypothetical protein